MPNIQSPLWPEDLSEDDLDWLEDRASQREFMGLQPRPDAEAGAVEDYRRWICTQG